MSRPSWLQALLRPNIASLQPYSSARDDFKGEAEVWLDANENPYPQHGLNRYPDPLAGALREKLAAIKGQPAESLFLGHGSDECIDLLLRAFCRPGQDAIIVQPPTYGMYRVSAAIQDAQIIEVPLSEDFQPRLDALKASYSESTKLLFFCSPNNPTGNAIAGEAILEAADAFEGITVVDEAYIDYCPDRSLLPQLAQHPRLVILQTLSKAWGLAAVRVGLAWAHPAVVAVLNSIKPPYNMSSPSVQAALAQLSNTAQLHERGEVLASIDERCNLYEALQELPLVQHVYPSQANFLLVRFANPKQVYEALLKKGIVTRDRSTLIHCEGCLRITVGTPDENQRLLQALSEMDA